MEKIVLKGRNAFDVIYGIGSKSPLDIDLLIAQNFIDLKDAEEYFEFVEIKEEAVSSRETN